MIQYITLRCKYKGSLETWEGCVSNNINSQIMLSLLKCHRKMHTQFNLCGAHPISRLVLIQLYTLPYQMHTNHAFLSKCTPPNDTDNIGTMNMTLVGLQYSILCEPKNIN